MISPEQDGKLWLHTRGMRKFGRPDIGMEGVEAMFLRPVKLHPATGGACIVYRELTGDLEDPDYNNEHYRLRWEDCEFDKD